MVYGEHLVSFWACGIWMLMKGIADLALCHFAIINISHEFDDILSSMMLSTKLSNLGWFRGVLT
jgi:hypothetical protein